MKKAIIIFLFALSFFGAKSQQEMFMIWDIQNDTLCPCDTLYIRFIYDGLPGLVHLNLEIPPSTAVVQTFIFDKATFAAMSYTIINGYKVYTLKIPMPCWANGKIWFRPNWGSENDLYFICPTLPIDPNPMQSPIYTGINVNPTQPILNYTYTDLNGLPSTKTPNTALIEQRGNVRRKVVFME